MKTQVGEIHIAADGGHYGLVVVDTETYGDVGDVVVRGFSESKGYDEHTYRLDTFKLSYRYSIVNIDSPEWVFNLIVRLKE